MTITYADGIAVEARLLSSEGNVMRLAIAGDEDVRLFRRIDGSWRAENGQHVELQYSWQDDWRALLPEESPFICSMTVARRLIANLMNGSELLDGGADPFYVFSAEKRRVRVHGTPSEV